MLKNGAASGLPLPASLEAISDQLAAAAADPSLAAAAAQRLAAAVLSANNSSSSNNDGPDMKVPPISLPGSLPLPFSPDLLWRYPNPFLAQPPPSPLESQLKAHLPGGLGHDPRTWSREDVVVFLRYCEREFDLDKIDMEKFNMNGKRNASKIFIIKVSLIDDFGHFVCPKKLIREEEERTS